MKPSLFLASSVEARDVLKVLASELDRWYTTQLWTEDFFQPGVSTIDSIADRIWEFDGGIFVLTPDDLLYSREKMGWTPRANVLFELGLFAGVLGIENCIQIVLKGKENPETALEGLLAQRAYAGHQSVHQPSTDGKTQVNSTRKFGINTITDLAGITWIESKCQFARNDGRDRFSLTREQTDSIVRRFKRRNEKDKQVLRSLFDASDLEVVWEEDGGKRHVAPVQVSTFGNRVRLRYGWHATGHEYICSLKFVAPDKLEGRWWDAQDRGYSGSASFQYRHRPPQLAGQWMGWSANGGVKSGRYCIRSKNHAENARRDHLLLRFAHLMRIVAG